MSENLQMMSREAHAQPNDHIVITRREWEHYKECKEALKLIAQGRWNSANGTSDIGVRQFARGVLNPPSN